MRLRNALLLFAAITAFPVLAVDDTGTFELDGNAVQDGMPDDWETLYNGGGSASPFVFFDDITNDTIFTGGGSKTPLDFPSYKYKSFTPPDKNDIYDAYAANYLVGGKQVIYFGASLLADNGDAELAFWFLQDDVGIDGAGGFNGNHKDEDVYVAVKFSNGGTQANITVFEWWAACDKDERTPDVAGSCAADNIRILIPQTSALCDGSGGIACAITNENEEQAPWPYTPKSGNDGFFPPTSFFEGGINIFDLFGSNQCFSSYMVTTGASTSFSSTAKDFALGDFNVCSVDATKTCVNDNEADDLPTAISYNVRGCGYNDGAGDINIQGLSNSIGGGASYVPADLTWYIPPNTFDPATDCDDPAALKAAELAGVQVDPTTHDLLGGDALVYSFSEVTSLNGPSDEVTVSADGTDGSTIDAATDTATCPVRVFDASLNASKGCTADLESNGSQVVVKINVAGQVCNDGEVDLTGLSLVDNVADGMVMLTPDSTTVPAGECVGYTGYYYPQSIPTGDQCPFMDQVTATADGPINSSGSDCSLNNDGTTTCTVNTNAATCLLRATDGDGDCATGPTSP